MNLESIRNSIADCGLICQLCSLGGECDCREENHCGKRLTSDGCFQYDCCNSNGLNGCWECSLAPCGKGMFAPNNAKRISSRTKLRAFITCIKEDGIDRFAEYILRNAENGIVYHRSGIYGDYDLATEEEVLLLLRTGIINDNN